MLSQTRLQRTIAWLGIGGGSLLGTTGCAEHHRGHNVGREKTQPAARSEWNTDDRSSTEESQQTVNLSIDNLTLDISVNAGPQEDEGREDGAAASQPVTVATRKGLWIPVPSAKPTNERVYTYMGQWGEEQTKQLEAATRDLLRRYGDSLATGKVGIGNITVIGHLPPHGINPRSVIPGEVETSALDQARQLGSKAASDLTNILHDRGVLNPESSSERLGVVAQESQFSEAEYEELDDIARRMGVPGALRFDRVTRLLNELGDESDGSASAETGAAKERARNIVAAHRGVSVEIEFVTLPDEEAASIEGRPEGAGSTRQQRIEPKHLDDTPPSKDSQPTGRTPDSVPSLGAKGPGKSSESVRPEKEQDSTDRFKALMEKYLRDTAATRNQDSQERLTASAPAGARTAQSRDAAWALTSAPAPRSEDTIVVAPSSSVQVRTESPRPASQPASAPASQPAQDKKDEKHDRWWIIPIIIPIFWWRRRRPAAANPNNPSPSPASPPPSSGAGGSAQSGIGGQANPQTGTGPLGIVSGPQGAFAPQTGVPGSGLGIVAAKPDLVLSSTPALTKQETHQVMEDLFRSVGLYGFNYSKTLADGSSDEAVNRLLARWEQIDGKNYVDDERQRRWAEKHIAVLQEYKGMDDGSLLLALRKALPVEFVRRVEAEEGWSGTILDEERADFRRLAQTEAGLWFSRITQDARERCETGELAIRQIQDEICRGWSTLEGRAPHANTRNPATRRKAAHIARLAWEMYSGD